jgi:citrate lyase subunit beta/citryl-CoA lyase
MRLRSLLFVPGDRPDRMQKAQETGADALILDLEDSVVPEKKELARRQVANFLANGSSIGTALFVRINPLATTWADQDLAAVIPHRPFGIVLPKAEGGASVMELHRRLLSLRNQTAQILPIATETPASIFALGIFFEANKRLCGLTWGAEDLPAAIGAFTAREADGRFTAPYEIVRALALFAAHAAGVPAIETIYPDLDNQAGLVDYAARGRRDGYSGMLAIHPGQVEVINKAFTPTELEITMAKRIVEAFENRSGEGVLTLDGKMLDAPHLKSARTLLANLSPEEKS